MRRTPYQKRGTAELTEPRRKQGATPNAARIILTGGPTDERLDGQPEPITGENTSADRPEEGSGANVAVVSAKESWTVPGPYLERGPRLLPGRKSDGPVSFRTDTDAEPGEDDLLERRPERVKEHQPG